MNSRDYKVFRQGCWYHVYNRGHNKELLFIDAQDYLAFAKRLAFILSIEDGNFKTLHPLEKEAFTIMAYCLMPNHFHLLIKQNTKVPVSLLMEKLGTSYGKYFNGRYDKVGSIFQDTFKAKLVENDGYLTYLSAYIHNNPPSPFEYEYSSIHEYLNPVNKRLCDINILLAYFDSNIENYRAFVAGYNIRQHQLIFKTLL